MEKTVDFFDCFPLYGFENGCMISKEKGCITVPIELELPEVFSLEDMDYQKLIELNSNIINAVGENIVLHYQHYFSFDKYVIQKEKLDQDFLNAANEYHFKDRPYLKLNSYLYISKVPKNYIKFNSKRANSFFNKTRNHYENNFVPKDFLDKNVINDFLEKSKSVCNLINNTNLIKAKIIGYDDLFSSKGIYHKAITLDSENGAFKDIDFSDNKLWVGEKQAQFFTLENLDQFDKDYVFKNEYSAALSTEKNLIPISNLFSLGFNIPYEHIINQYVYIPESDKMFKSLRKKAKTFNQFKGKNEDDSNSIYAKQILEFNSDVISKHKNVVFYHLNLEAFTGDSDINKMNYDVNAAFSKLKIKIKENTIDRKNLYLASLPGNSVGLPCEMYMPMSSDMASALTYLEGEYKESSYGIDGVRLVDRLDGRPLNVSIYKEPEKKSWIFNRGMLVASGSGGGKSFFCNHYFSSELRIGSEIIIMEDGNSYDRLIEVFNGTILEHDDNNPFTFNPFLLDKYDYTVKDNLKSLTEEKIIRLITIIGLISGSSDNDESSIVKNIRVTVLEKLIVGYYNEMWLNKKEDYKFNTFFEYIEKQIFIILKEEKIKDSYFDPNVFLFLLKKFYKGGVRENLLNKTDSRIENLSDSKLIYFKLRGLIDNKLLFPIISLMIMELFNKKLMDQSKRHINKIMASDEAWKVLMKPELAEYFNNQSRTARKMGGQPIFISQKVDDFTASPIIKDTIVVNSHIKVFLDMSEFADTFEKIQEVTSVTEKQKKFILSINKNLPKNRMLRECAICWKDKIKVYGIETSKVEKCIYETNPNESKLINEIHQSSNKDWELTAKNYAEL